MNVLIDLPENSPVEIAVISDTHSNVRRTLAAIREIERRDVDLVLHCGDIGSSDIVWLFAGRPTRFVFGNVDDSRVLQPVIEEAGLTCDGQLGDFSVAGVRIALIHGHDARRLRTALDSQEYDLVCTGHTHQRQWERLGRTHVLNPGAIHRASPPSFAFVRLPELEVEFISLSDANA